MTAALPASTARSLPVRPAGLAVSVGLLALALPTLWDFYRLIWTHDQDTHGPIILAAILVAFWMQRSAFTFSVGRREQIWAFATLCSGLILYTIGRSQSFLQMEGLGLVVVVFGAILLSGGYGALKRLGYVATLLVFVIPLPQSLIDSLLLPLKLELSDNVVRLLSALGLPIANHGVVISIGFYQLQVADACAGLRSLVSLSAIGLLFIYFVRSSRLVSGLLIASIPFVALAANFIRVTALVLVTYYLGGDSGAAFHDYAAYLEVLVAIGGFLLLHGVLERGFASLRPAS